MRIGILTSGGDCPGINATIRGVCKTAINHYGMEVFGIHSGFRGLVDNDVVPLTEASLTGLLNMGGTILGTSREKPFKRRGTAVSEDKPAMRAGLYCLYRWKRYAENCSQAGGDRSECHQYSQNDR